VRALPRRLSVEEMNDPFLEAVGVNTEQAAVNESIKERRNHSQENMVLTFFQGGNRHVT
jgi:hypothetical protein